MLRLAIYIILTI